MVTKPLNSRLKTSHELRGSLIKHSANSGFYYSSERECLVKKLLFMIRKNYLQLGINSFLNEVKFLRSSRDLKHSSLRLSPTFEPYSRVISTFPTFI